MMKNPTPAKVQYYGYNFLINPTVNLNKNGEVNNIGINRIQASKMIRQFVKFKYGKSPKFKIWVRSESFSGGSSIDVYLSNKNGTTVDPKIFETIEKFVITLRSGHFDGMTDSFVYKVPDKSEHGTILIMYTSYTRVINEAPYGTKEHKLRFKLTHI